MHMLDMLDMDAHARHGCMLDMYMHMLDMYMYMHMLHAQTCTNTPKTFPSHINKQAGTHAHAHTHTHAYLLFL